MNITNMNSPTIAQAQLSIAQDPWEFLIALPHTAEAKIMYMLLLAGIIGGFASWLVKWAKGQAGPLNIYFVREGKFTILAGASYIGICLTAITSGIFITPEDTFVGWANVLWFGVTNAFGADMIANKGNKEYDPTSDKDRRGT